MPLMSELVGQKGIYFLLNRVYEKRDILDSMEITNLIKEIGISDESFSQLIESGLFIESHNGFFLSSFGKRVTLLLRALNDEEELSKVFHQLIHFYPELRPYELITQGVTDYFIDSLYARSDFIRVYICSPWIRLDEDHIDKVKGAVFKASKRYPNLQILIITLPLERYHDRKAIETLKILKQLRAEIVTNSRLHAKLYISEPGPFGGIHYAIFGSENLTGRGNIELAIKIENDNEILKKLNIYFYDIWQSSKILKEV